MKALETVRDYDDLDLSFKFIPLAICAAANVLLTTLTLVSDLTVGEFHRSQKGDAVGKIIHLLISLASAMKISLTRF